MAENGGSYPFNKKGGWLRRGAPMAKVYAGPGQMPGAARAQRAAEPEETAAEQPAEEDRLAELRGAVAEEARLRGLDLPPAKLAELSEEELTARLERLKAMPDTGGMPPIGTVYAGPGQMPGYTPQPMGFVYAGPVPSSGGFTGFMHFEQTQGQPPAQAEAEDARERIGACQNCGCDLFERSKFCPNCGSTITWE